VSWRWIGRDLALAIHERQVAEHGGLGGVRDLGLVESALARPQQLAAYGDSDAAALAAAYASAIVRNHGFADGNKRTAWVLARVFLLDNGHPARFAPAEVVQMVEGLAGGRVDEAAFASWIRTHLAP
jgi:death-on-curing protein